MFKFFKKKSEKDKLSEKYHKLMKEAHQLSHSDRTASDKKMAEAEAVAQQIEQLPE